MIKHGKWFNYRGYSEWVVANNPVFPPGSRVHRVRLYSALATFNDRRDPTIVHRHKILNKALTQCGVEISLGQFKRAFLNCRADCKKEFFKFEEKQSDINLAMGVVESFAKDDVDCAVIVSGDTDQVATINAVKLLFPGKLIGAIQPAFKANEDLRRAAHFHAELLAKHYENHQMPLSVTLANGKVITRPKAW